MRQGALEKKLAVCTPIRHHLETCLGELPTSDPKCLLLHQAWLICAAREVAPAAHQRFLECASRHRTKPELCEEVFQVMWNGVLAEVQRDTIKTQRTLMTDAEEEALLDCKAFKEVSDKALGEHGLDSPQTDAALEQWMQCVFPKTCTADWALMQRCMDEKGSADACVAEGRPLVRCVTDFTFRYYRRMQ